MNQGINFPTKEQMDAFFREVPTGVPMQSESRIIRAGTSMPMPPINYMDVAKLDSILVLKMKEHKNATEFLK